MVATRTSGRTGRRGPPVGRRALTRLREPRGRRPPRLRPQCAEETSPGDASFRVRALDSHRLLLPQRHPVDALCGYVSTEMETAGYQEPPRCCFSPQTRRPYFVASHRTSISLSNPPISNIMYPPSSPTSADGKASEKRSTTTSS